MLYVSELLLEHREITTFSELIEIVKLRAKNEMFFRMDLKPPFPDTPENWEIVLESAFSGFNNDA
ncbi:MAG: sulfur relay protein DsrC [Granulosicoccus sp.]|nr:sulfur relay protein DsrC [Granulosicoccus sp.]